VTNGRARFQPIEMGAAGERGVIARKGLRPGDVVVRRGQEIRPGARVRVAEGG
jgi:hypothetical protein